MKIYIHECHDCGRTLPESLLYLRKAQGRNLIHRKQIRVCADCDLQRMKPEVRAALAYLSKAKVEVIQQAHASGYEVTYSEGCIRVLRLSMHQKPVILQGLLVYLDGRALDATVRLDLAKSLRSAAEWREVLGL
jgi:hypothetical protein